MTVSNGGEIFAGAVTIGVNTGDVNNAYNVGGLGLSSIVSNGVITIGSTSAGSNQMTVTNASLLSGAVTLGKGSSNNTATVQTGASWNLLNTIFTVGTGGSTGNVLALQGGIITTTNLIVSVGSTDTGDLVNVTGGSLYVTNAAATGNLILGQGGFGSMTVTGGGTVVANQITLGAAAGGSGTLTINNLGTVIATNGALTLGAAAGTLGNVTLNSNGLFEVGSIPTIIGSNGTGGLTINGGVISNVVSGAANVLNGLTLGYGQLAPARSRWPVARSSSPTARPPRN